MSRFPEKSPDSRTQFWLRPETAFVRVVTPRILRCQFYFLFTWEWWHGVIQTSVKLLSPIFILKCLLTKSYLSSYTYFYTGNSMNTSRTKDLQYEGHLKLLSKEQNPLGEYLWSVYSFIIWYRQLQTHGFSQSIISFSFHTVSNCQKCTFLLVLECGLKDLHSAFSNLPTVLLSQHIQQLPKNQVDMCSPHINAGRIEQFLSSLDKYIYSWLPTFPIY